FFRGRRRSGARLLIDAGLIFSRGQVANGLEQPSLIEPIDPVQRRKFHALEMPPRALPVNHLRLEEADDRFSESIVVRITATPDRWQIGRASCRERGQVAGGGAAFEKRHGPQGRTGRVAACETLEKR